MEPITDTEKIDMSRHVVLFTVGDAYIRRESAQ